MIFADRLTLDAPKRTADGFLAVRARAARTGVYDYSGREIDPENKHGLRDQASVKVLRDNDTVFDEKSARSFLGKPVTDNHPSESVTAANWRDHARGTIMGALRDGDYLAFDILLTDATLIDKVEGGKRELSNGYTSDLEFGDFKAEDGTVCQARQSTIFGNHVAVVDRGRAGASCAITDAARCEPAPQAFLDSLSKEKPAVKNILVDGLNVDVANADTAEATIKKLIADRDAATDKVTALDAKAVEDAATIVAKDAEITKLTADLAAAKITPAQMRDAAKAYALVVGKAKAAGIAVTDEMDEVGIMKAVVDKAMPGNTYAGDHVKIAFETLTKDAKVDDSAAPFFRPATMNDGDKLVQDARADMIAELTGAKPATTEA